MSRFLPSSALLLAAPLAFLSLGLTGCDTVYSSTYAYQKTNFAMVTLKNGKRELAKSYAFEPYEQHALAKAEAEKEKAEVERLRMAAQSNLKTSADQPSGGAGLTMDSGLGASSSPLGMGGSGGIPGLDAPAASPSMSGGIPGLDATPSMSGAAMDGGMMSTPTPAPAAKPGATMLPGL